MKVLLAIDGSAISKEAVRRLADLVNLPAAEVKVVTVAPNPSLPDVAGVMGPPYLDFTLLSGQIRAEAEANLDEAERLLAGRGVVPASVIRQGDPAAEILEEIRVSQPDLVVVGSHGRTGFRKLLLGSVSARIVNEAPCPVLVVKDPRLHED